MAKYIGTYDNENAIASALTADELSRPFVALANDTKRVYYGQVLNLAQIGDIVVYDSARTSLRFIHLADYNTTTYPTASYEPVGVVVENQTSTLVGGENDVKMLGKNWVDRGNPDTGDTKRVEMNWGPDGTTGAQSTTDGKANTELVLTFATGQTDWQTAQTINYNGNGVYPLFQSAWRYHTYGTNQGDWYIPAQDEINFLSDSTAKSLINSGLTAIGSGVLGDGYFASSTELNSYVAKTFGSGNNKFENGIKTSGFYWAARPFYKGTILPM